MLLEAGDICAGLASPTARQPAPTRVFVITCDRPAAVERLLESMLRTSKLSQHDALFLVDDSRQPANREANREAVARFNLRSPRTCSTGRRRRRNSGRPGPGTARTRRGHTILLTARMGREKTYGRSRTLCLLLSVGYRALVMDDDILCQAVLPPITESG